jgi:hypothetical protein
MPVVDTAYMVDKMDLLAVAPEDTTGKLDTMPESLVAAKMAGIPHRYNCLPRGDTPLLVFQPIDLCFGVCFDVRWRTGFALLVCDNTTTNCPIVNR